MRAVRCMANPRRCAVLRKPGAQGQGHRCSCCGRCQWHSCCPAPHARACSIPSPANTCQRPQCPTPCCHCLCALRRRSPFLPARPVARGLRAADGSGPALAGGAHPAAQPQPADLPADQVPAAVELHPTPDAPYLSSRHCHARAQTPPRAPACMHACYPFIRWRWRWRWRVHTHAHAHPHACWPMRAASWRCCGS